MTPSRPAGGAEPEAMTVLVGDIGGTNARLAEVRIEPGGRARILRDATYPSERFAGLAPIVTLFLRDTQATIRHACFAVPGPVHDGHVETTNLRWLVDEASLAAQTGIPSVRLINDFAAVGHGIQRLQPDDVVTVKPGRADPDGAIAVIGPGTGLGHGIVMRRGDEALVLPSEGGHADFAPADEVEWELVRHLRRRHDHASWERVVSGPGIVTLYRFLASRPGASERLDVRAAMEQEDPAAVITRYALDGSDPICVDTLDRFVRALAAQAGNFALTVLATGGVFIAGGIAPRILPKLRHASFGMAFMRKGRFADDLGRIPVHVVIDPHVGLRGAAAVAARTKPRSLPE